MTIVKHPINLTIDFICSLHATLMSSSRVLCNYQQSDKLKFTNIGQTRQQTCINVSATTHVADHIIKVQFCPYDSVNAELDLFCTHFNVSNVSLIICSIILTPLQNLIREEIDTMDPFAMAAWISHVFITIHPFEVCYVPEILF